MTAINWAPLSTEAPWIVIKFGGTSVSKREYWDNIRAIAAQHRACGKRVLIVVSALSGITDKLKNIAEAGTDTTARMQAHAEIVARHEAMLIELMLPLNILQEQLTKLDALVHAPRPESAALAWQAQVLSLGELLSSTLGAIYLDASGLTTCWLDARAYLRAEPLPNQNAWSKYLSASVPTTPDPAFATALAAQGEIFITQGFIARNAKGETVILGRGGSDTSAAYFGALLKAEKVEIWTDVCGMFSANPHQVSAARLLSRLDYEEAQEIVTTGAKVLHPRCLNPLREAQVPLVIKDTNRPELIGTEIGTASTHGPPSIKAISSRAGITLVSMESIGMWQQVGFLSDLFAIFKRHGLSVDLISTAETNVTVSLDSSDNLLNSDVLSALCADLAQVCRVKVITPCAAITLVGRGIRSLLHQLSGVLAEFGTLRVHQLTQSSNNLNLTFVVDEDVAAGLVPRLHALLIQAEAMRISDPTVFGPSWCELYADNAAQTRALPWWIARREALLALAAKGTPRYIYDRASVRVQAQSLRALAAVDQWFYAIKANAHPALLTDLVEQGFGLECVSQPELAAVCAAHPNLAPQHILFTPNFASREEYAAARVFGVRITLDNLHPLAHWGEVFAGGEVILRIDLGVGRGHHDKVRTGGAQSKFGLSLEELPEFRRLAAQHNVRVVGLHAHLGSGILDYSHWHEVYAQLASLAEPFGTIELLNIGGGLGVPARADETPLDLVALGVTLAEVKTAYPQYQLWLEPGRYLVADAGVLLARVTQLKRKGEFHYVGIDAGMNSLLRPALYGAHHQIVNLTRLDKAADTLYQVVGPICESGDVLGNNRYLPQTFEGDVLLIAQVGAYGAVMGSRYNLREPAAEIVL